MEGEEKKTRPLANVNEGMQEITVHHNTKNNIDLANDEVNCTLLENNIYIDCNLKAMIVLL